MGGSHPVIPRGHFWYTKLHLQCVGDEMGKWGSPDLLSCYSSLMLCFSPFSFFFFLSHGGATHKFFVALRS